jgi:hypothetical protein
MSRNNDLQGHELSTPNDLVGVRGWLLFLCISWTILSPAFSLFVIGVTLNEIPSLLPYSNIAPLAVPMTVIDSVLGLGVVAFSIVAGIRLWTVQPRAVSLARSYLIALAAYTIVSSGLNYFAVPPAFSTRTAADFLAPAVRQLAYTAIWLAYFARSERVAVTYGLARE